MPSIWNSILTFLTYFSYCETSKTLCAVGFPHKANLLKALTHFQLSYSFVLIKAEEIFNSTNCSIILKYSRDPPPHLQTQDQVLCPESCYPQPLMYTHPAFFHSIDNIPDDFLPCSLTKKMARLIKNNCTSTLKHIALARYNTSDLNHTTIGSLSILEILLIRQLMDCNEPSKWRHEFPPISKLMISTFTALQRPVESLIIWIGSRKKIDLTREQSSVLKYVPLGAWEMHTVAWAATDDMYSCRIGSTKCGKGNNKFKYLPSSAINYMSEGWGCAQRRPLRALAHVLALFRPRYIVLLDDDSFFNYPLFIDTYSKFLYGAMSKAPVVMGEFTGRTGDSGHLTTRGMHAGGSGYVIGKALLERLIARRIEDFETPPSANAPPDVYRSNQQKEALSLSAELKRKMQRSKHGCEFGKPVDDPLDFTTTCLLSPNSIAYPPKPALTQEGGPDTNESIILRPGYYFPTRTRLIDTCVAMMADEHTCLHSDHSVGRCFVYGAAASPVSVVCQSFATINTPIPAAVRLGFCFSTPECNTSKHITCHRYQPVPHQTGPLKAMRIPIYNTTKFKCSSGFDGKVTDSYL